MIGIYYKTVDNALNTFKCNCVTPLRFKGLKIVLAFRSGESKLVIRLFWQREIDELIDRKFLEQTDDGNSYVLCLII